MTPFQVHLNIWAYRSSTETLCFFLLLILHWKKDLPYNSIELDLAATLFTNETRETLHPPLHRHSGEYIMSEFSFLGQLSL